MAKPRPASEHVGMAIPVKVKDASKWIIEKAHETHSNQTKFFLAWVISLGRYSGIATLAGIIAPGDQILT